jgi:hypothetical protein
MAVASERLLVWQGWTIHHGSDSPDRRFADEESEARRDKRDR